MLLEEDYFQLEESGRSAELVKRQYESLIGEPSYISNIKPATLGDGIISLNDYEKKEFLDVFNNSDEKRWIKFVPASGAASRMFVELNAFQEEKNKKGFSFNQYLNSSKGIMLKKLFKKLKKLPFYAKVREEVIEKFKNLDENSFDFFEKFIHLVLINFDTYPKALIPFFIDKKGQEWTPFEAQILESISVEAEKKKTSIHLTIDKTHRKLFDNTLNIFRNRKRADLDISFSVEYSHQNRLTDTPCIALDDQFIRDKLGHLIFRKGGHGSLLENLNHLDADFIWIKNIDNIQLGESNQLSEKWMKILAGKLLSIQKLIFEYLRKLEKLKGSARLDKIVKFINENFDTEYDLNPNNKLSHEVLFDYLNRPVRICGMIPNEGSVGGGPFWKKELRGKSLQIIEGVELDNSIEEHKKAILNSTHFNPVMLICGITNYKGEKFSLHDFRDEKRSMISRKVYKNKSIKILEWPGLWNGGMAEWNSIFVEVPKETFNPVKSIIDLLR
ncbi:MAG: DUF4301 family protein [Flavobacteriaceae bacterium]